MNLVKLLSVKIINILDERGDAFLTPTDRQLIEQTLNEYISQVGATFSTYDDYYNTIKDPEGYQKYVDKELAYQISENLLKNSQFLDHQVDRNFTKKDTKILFILDKNKLLNQK